MRADRGALNMHVSSTLLPLPSCWTPCCCEENYTRFVLREIYVFMRLFVIYVTTVSVVNTTGLW